MKNKELYFFLAENLHRNEQHDYLKPLENENYSLENYHEKSKTHGTIALLTNLDDDKTPRLIIVQSPFAVWVIFSTKIHLFFNLKIKKRTTC
jgi:hypothetical protein